MDLNSKSIRLRLIDVRDAEFVLGLRLDETYNTFLSPVAADLDKQVQWIWNYKAREAAGREFYFIIERQDAVRCGTVRVYDIRDGQFTWGSWILNAEKTRYSAIESALLVYKFGFEIMDFRKSVFEVIKENVKVVSFHEKFGAKRTGEDDANIYFELDRSDFESRLPYFEGILNGGP
jgi:RimJ/RimL family protein N-acetyltransferase